MEEMRKEQQEYALEQNKNRNLRSFKIGDLVLVDIEVLADKDQESSKKFIKLKEGPYSVIEKISDTSYELKHLLTETCITRNIDKITKYNIREKDENPLSNDLPLSGDTHGWNDIDEEEVEVEEIIDHRIMHKNKNTPYNEYR
eukprot:Awhi_evm1s11491